MIGKMNISPNVNDTVSNDVEIEVKFVRIQKKCIKWVSPTFLTEIFQP